MYQQGGTIKKALDSIASNEYVLPAIQREFVWSRKQICRLFDSVMQGYPFGDFLFWRYRFGAFRRLPLLRIRSRIPSAGQPTLP